MRHFAKSTPALRLLAFVAILICVTGLPTRSFAEQKNKTTETVASDRTLGDLKTDLKAKRAELVEMKKAAATQSARRAQAQTAVQPAVGPLIGARTAEIAAIVVLINQIDKKTKEREAGGRENRYPLGKAATKNTAAVVVPCGGPSNPCNAKPLPVMRIRDTKALSSNGPKSLDARGDRGSLLQQRLQQTMERRAKATETLSNLQKKTSETNSKIIGNMK